jgi:hypothetical protein
LTERGDSPTPLDHGGINGMIHNSHVDPSQVAHSISSNSTGDSHGGLVKRKSVRMALPPSIPATPFVEQATHIAFPGVTPTTERPEWTSRIGVDPAGWEDSSEEDPDYARVRLAFDRAEKSFKEAGGILSGRNERKKPKPRELKSKQGSSTRRR